MSITEDVPLMPAALRPCPLCVGATDRLFSATDENHRISTIAFAYLKCKECDGNCSFVSGHAAGAFFILSLSWVFRQKRWLLLGLFLGALVGTGRVLQGGHFVSDVVFAFWAVYFSSLLTAMCFGLRSTDVDPSLPSASPRVFT